MKKTANIAPWIIFGIITAAVLWLVISFVNVFHNVNTPLGFDKTDKIFEENMEQFVFVSDYFAASDSESICIWHEKAMDTKYVNPRNLPDNPQLEKSMNILVQNGCELFLKVGNTIKFQMWDNLEKRCGILYLDENILPVTDTLTKLEKICDNWYYYEEDYDGQNTYFEKDR